MVTKQQNVWIYFKNSGSNGDDRSPPVHFWLSAQTKVTISFHCNKLTCFSICQLLMTGLWCLANKEWARAALPTASLATTTWPTLVRRRTGRRFLLLLDTGCAQKPRWPHSGFFSCKISETPFSWQMSQHRKLPWKNQQSQHHCCRYTGIQSGFLTPIFHLFYVQRFFNFKCF